MSEVWFPGHKALTHELIYKPYHPFSHHQKCLLESKSTLKVALRNQEDPFSKQGWFSIWKLNTLVMYHINIRHKRDRGTSVAAEKTFVNTKRKSLCTTILSKM